MRLVAFSNDKINLSNGLYDGDILNESIKKCYIFLDRDNNTSFYFETLHDLALSSGKCKVKILNNKAAIYI